MSGLPDFNWTIFPAFISFIFRLLLQEKVSMLQPEEITIGNRVCLNSGSPVLTITAIRSQTVEVEWRDGEGIEKSTFPVVCLRQSSD